MIILKYIHKDRLEVLEGCRERKLTIDETQHFALGVQCSSMAGAERMSAQIRAEGGSAWIEEVEN